jgi:hypothetical protein
MKSRLPEMIEPAGEYGDIILVSLLLSFFVRVHQASTATIMNEQAVVYPRFLKTMP